MKTERFLQQGEMVRIEAGQAAAVRVASGDVWITQHEDSNDYFLKDGANLELSGSGVTLVTAFKPTLLELYAADPLGVLEKLVARLVSWRPRPVAGTPAVIGAGLAAR